jgi:hypothetical protein
LSTHFQSYVIWAFHIHIVVRFFYLSLCLSPCTSQLLFFFNLSLPQGLFPSVSSLFFYLSCVSPLSVSPPKTLSLEVTITDDNRRLCNENVHPGKNAKMKQIKTFAKVFSKLSRKKHFCKIFRDNENFREKRKKLD